MRCIHCDAELALASGERVGFRDSCLGCSADLHACVQCQHHDPAAYNGCREPSAERVSDAERANRCEWFRPRADSPDDPKIARREARSQLDDLFKK